MRYDTKPISDYDLSSLRVLGSVGEPINPEAWKWYDENVGKGKCSVVDTYWQTETGAHIAANLPGETQCSQSCHFIVAQCHHPKTCPSPPACTIHSCPSMLPARVVHHHYHSFVTVTVQV